MRKACTIPPKKSVCKRHARIFLDFFDFVEVEVHQRFAAENGHEDLETALVVVDGLDAAVEVLERAVLDADLLADLEFDLGTRLLGALLEATSASESTTGLLLPRNSMTRGVELTRCHVASFITISMKT